MVEVKDNREENTWTNYFKDNSITRLSMVEQKNMVSDAIKREQSILEYTGQSEYIKSLKEVDYNLNSLLDTVGKSELNYISLRDVVFLRQRIQLSNKREDKRGQNYFQVEPLSTFNHKLPDGIFDKLKQSMDVINDLDDMEPYIITVTYENIAVTGNVLAYSYHNHFVMLGRMADYENILYYKHYDLMPFTYHVYCGSWFSEANYVN